ncbi:MAG: xylulokinase [Massiliimalia sp.]|jgi:xylulokinase
MAYLLGIDVGTSGTKTVLFSEDGKAAASYTVEYPMSQPKNGYAEQNPEDWWNAAVQTIQAVLGKSGVDPKEVKGIGISGQMHSLVMLDKDGKVIRPSILWCDARTGEECAEITEIIGAKRLIEITANPALAGFTAGKIRWVQKHEPENYARCAHILLPKDYIRYQLTGEFATEVSDASGMQLLDVPNRCWSDEVLTKLGIDKGLLGKVYESQEITGTVSASVAKLTGLAEGTPVVGGAADNAGAAVGTGVVRNGKAFTTIGSSGVVYTHSSKVAIDQGGRVHTFCSCVPGEWLVMGCTLSAGMSLKWLRDNFFAAEMETAGRMGVDPYYLMDKEAAQVEIGSNKLIYLPYLMGERSPILDPNARGVFFGLSGMHTKKEMLRAVMEGVTYSQRHCMEVIKAMGVEFSEMLACGGGGSSPLWRQMLADVYGIPVMTLENREGPAMGVAILAGVGAGIYDSVTSACDQLIRVKDQHAPIPENVVEYEKFYQLYTQIYPQLKEQFAALQKL